MKYAVDKIENNIVTLESLDDNCLVEIDIHLLPSGIKEGSILIYQDNTYILDVKEEQIRRDTIKSKFDMLRKKN